MPKKSKKKGRAAKGEGSVYYSASEKKYIGEIRWTTPDNVKHRKRFKSAYEYVVKENMEEFMETINCYDNLSSEDTFKCVCEKWLLLQAMNLKPTSILRKRVTAEQQVYPYIGDTYIELLNCDDIQNMVQKLYDSGLSYSTIKKAYELTRSCIRYYNTTTQNKITACEGVILPTSKKKENSDIKFFTENERELIIKESLRKYKNGSYVYRAGPAIVILMYSGMRIGELLALTWDDIDYDNKIINITKNAVWVKLSDVKSPKYGLIIQDSTKTLSGARTIPLTQNAEYAFREMQKMTGKEEYIMMTKKHNHIAPKEINRMFHDILMNVNIMSDNSDDSFGVHTLRHTFASMLFNNGWQTKPISKMLGHSTTEITNNIYVHVRENYLLNETEKLNESIENISDII